MAYPGLARLASFLRCVNRRPAVNAYPHGPLHHPGADEETYMTQARRRHTALLSAIAALALLTGFPGAAKADWTVCNRVAETMNIVIAYIGHDGGFVSKGWWTLRSCGGCAKVLLPSQAGGMNDVFLHAQVPGGAGFIEGDHTFCVTNGNFLMNAKDPISCPATKLFKLEHIDLTKNWTANITGRAPSGAVCID
jgi:uncharacterized membrane protein